MAEEKEGTIGQLLILATILGIALPLCNTVAVLLGLAGENPMMTLWPGYLPLLVFMIGQERTIRDFLNIVASGLVGIVTAVVSLLIIHFASSVMPELAAMFVGTFVCIFVFSIFKEIIPTFFNNYGFLYFLISSTIMASFSDQMFTLALTWGASTIITTAVYTFITFGSIAVILKVKAMSMLMKKKEDLTPEELQKILEESGAE